MKQEIESFYLEQHQLNVEMLNLARLLGWRRRKGIAKRVKKKPVTLNNKADLKEILHQ